MIYRQATSKRQPNPKKLRSTKNLRRLCKRLSSTLSHNKITRYCKHQRHKTHKELWIILRPKLSIDRWFSVKRVLPNTWL
jgi:hypothetical protein